MKTTVEIQDDLLRRAKQRARDTGRTLRSVMEDGLRRALDDERPPNGYKMPDMSVGDPNAENPLKKYTWPQLRDIIYERGFPYEDPEEETE